jgi:NADPH2:quinone reductase
MRAIQVNKFGGPEVLELVEVDEPEAADRHVMIDVVAAGVNYADTHQAEDSYLTATELPIVPGSEVVGTTPDRRRVLALLESGGYAERAVARPELVFPVPEGLADGDALALGSQGATAWHILRTSAHLQPGDSVVVHAGAGGVGSLAIQLARLWGAGRVISSASSDEKRALTLELGADAAIDSNAGDLKTAIEEANGGRKVDVVLEMVGGPAFHASLAALAPFGRLVTYGMASRQETEPVAPGALLRRSRGVIGMWLAHAAARPKEMLAPQLAELFELAARGELRPIVGATYPLAEARRAHEDLRARRTTGKLVLDPRA